MKSLEELIGSELFLIITFMHPDAFQKVTLRGVEVGGLWIESHDMTQGWLAALNMPSGKTPIFFVPYAQIKFGWQASSELSLSEKAFGA